MKKCGGRCRKVCGFPILFYTSPTLLHSSPLPNTLPYSFYTNPIHSSTLSHFFHIPPYLTQLPKLPKIYQFSHHPYSPKFSTLPRFFPILPHTDLIIYPILKFLTFLIFLSNQSSNQVHKTHKNFENQNKKWQHNI